MPGIYIHIPFCRQACHYCDFHFSTSLKSKKDFLTALKKEISLQKDYLPTGRDLKSRPTVGSVYFGGGTPSVLSKEDILEVIDELSKYFSIAPQAEITLEANPDDLSLNKLKELSETPINRLSIGVQSFSDEDLKFLNRIHNAKEAIESIHHAKEAGFSNITIDLIYGIQTLTDTQWKKNIEKAFSLDVPHISCYSLTVEPRTALSAFIRKGKAEDINVEKSAEQFEFLMEEMKKNNFIQYEISNFCKSPSPPRRGKIKPPLSPEGGNQEIHSHAFPPSGGLRGTVPLGELEGAFYSRHNSSYWKGAGYLGLGPSAHSYNGNSRQWNVRSNSNYINSLNKNILPFEKEVLTESQKYNEYVLTSLRTIWGTDVNFIKKSFSPGVFSHFEKEMEPFLEQKMLSQERERIFLTRKGKFFADRIAGDLFIVS